MHLSSQDNHDNEINPELYRAVKKALEDDRKEQGEQEKPAHQQGKVKQKFAGLLGVLGGALIGWILSGVPLPPWIVAIIKWLFHLR